MKKITCIFLALTMCIMSFSAVAVDETTENTYTVFLYAEDIYPSSIYHYAAWAWPNGGEGAWYTPASEKDGLGCYRFDIPTECSNIIFAIFSIGYPVDWNYRKYQTADLTYDSENPYFLMKMGTWANTVCYHEYGEPEIITDASCAEHGIEKYTCIYCGNSYENQLPKTPHSSRPTDPNLYTVTQEPICNSGRAIYKCTQCNQEVEFVLNEKHNPDMNNMTVMYEPTCEFTGFAYAPCLDCGHEKSPVYIEQTVFEHSWDENLYCAICNQSATVKVDSACGTMYFANIVVAFEKAYLMDGDKTITLLQDTTYYSYSFDYYGQFIGNTGLLTLDLNGKTLTFDNNFDFDGAYLLDFGLQSASGNKFAVKNGNIKLNYNGYVIRIHQGELTMTDVTVSGNAEYRDSSAIVVASNSKVKLTRVKNTAPLVDFIRSDHYYQLSGEAYTELIDCDASYVSGAEEQNTVYNYGTKATMVINGGKYTKISNYTSVSNLLPEGKCFKSLETGEYIAPAKYSSRYIYNAEVVDVPFTVVEPLPATKMVMVDVPTRFNPLVNSTVLDSLYAIQCAWSCGTGLTPAEKQEGGSNLLLTYDREGTDTVSCTFSYNGYEVTTSSLVYVTSDNYVVAGTANLCGSTWDGKDINNLMTLSEGTDLYVKVFESVPVGEYLFKVQHNLADGTHEWISDGTDSNIKFSVTSSCDVSIIYNKATGTVSVEGDGVLLATDFYVDAIYVVGNGDSCWLNNEAWNPSAEANKMTEISEGVYQITYTDVEFFDAYEFKFAANGTWADNWGDVDIEGNGWGDSDLSAGGTFTGKYNGQNFVLDVIYEYADVTLTIDLTEFDYVTKEGAVVKVDVVDSTPVTLLGCTVAGDEALCGSDWDSTDANNQMSEENGSFVKTYENVACGVYNIKVYEHLSNGTDEVSENVVFTVRFPADVTVSYNSETGAVEIIADGVVLGEAFYIESITAVGNGYVDGWMNGASYDPYDEYNDLKESDSLYGVYTITFTGVPKSNDLQFKFAFNHSWTDNLGAAEQNLAVTDGYYELVNNGGNFILDTTGYDWEYSDITFELDMNYFDYDTREGAVVSVSVKKNIEKELIVVGGTEGVDYIFEGGVWKILTSTPLTFSGTTKTNRIVVVKDVNANITLDNLSIDMSYSDESCAAFEIQGNANIILVGISNLISNYLCAGLQVPEGASVTISGGSLNVTGGDAGAGIGGGNMMNGGTIIINGGLIRSNGGINASGIGGGDRGATGTVIINGGTVYATGGVGGAGIGGGQYGNGAYQCEGSITINEGDIVASGGENGAGIGGGYEGNGGNINIHGGNICAYGGQYGAGIGGGGNYYSEYGDGAELTVTGGVVSCYGGVGGAGIGGGQNGDGGNVDIQKGYVMAVGGEGAVGIGEGIDGQVGTFATGTEGTGFVIAEGISDTSNKDAWTGVIFEGTNGGICGNTATIADFAHIPEGYILTIEAGQTLEILENAKLYNDGTIINNGTLNCSGLYSQDTKTGSLQGNAIHRHSFKQTVISEEYKTDIKCEYYYSCECGIHGDETFATNIVYFNNSLMWSGTIYAYSWYEDRVSIIDSAEWPGVPMTFVDTNEYGQDIYSIEILSNLCNVIFTNGSFKTDNIINYEECGHYYATEDTVIDENGDLCYVSELAYTHNHDANYICQNCGRAVMKFESFNISLGSDIMLNYYVNKYSDIVPQVKFTINGYTKTVNAIDAGEQYMFMFDGVAPQWMGDIVTAELIVDDKIIETKQYSVVEYLNTLKSKTAVDLNYTSYKYEAMKTLINDLLVYGGAAQNYKGHNTDKLVSEDAYGTEYQPITAPTGIGVKNGDNVKFAGANLWFDSVNQLAFKFVATDLDGVLFKLKINDGAEILIDKADIKDNGDGTYTIMTDGIKAIGFDDVYTLTVYDTSENRPQAKIAYSVKYYVYTKQNGTDAMAELAKATYNYGLSAMAFYTAE